MLSLKKVCEIGKGGFATVHFARRPDGSGVAVKEIDCARAERSASSIANLWRERDICRRLSSSVDGAEMHLAMLLESAASSAAVTLVFELCEGATLWEHVRATSRELQLADSMKATAAERIDRIGNIGIVRRHASFFGDTK